jgi:hypothetical protein
MKKLRMKSRRARKRAYAQRKKSADQEFQEFRSFQPLAYLGGQMAKEFQKDLDNYNK